MFTWLKKSELNNTHLWMALAAFAVMIAVNVAAGSSTLIGGIRTADVSDMYKNLFTPAGFTFGIWSVIYLLLAAFMLRAFEIIKLKKPAVSEDTLNRHLALFSVSSVLNVAWLVAWHMQLLWLSVVVMIGLLVVLSRIIMLLGKERMSLREYVLIRAPFSVYLGWISVATIANIAAWLVSVEWDGFGISETTWMVLLLVIVAVLAVAKGLLRRDPLYVTVFVWAYLGILYNHLSADGLDGAHPPVIVALAVLMPVLIMTSIQLAREYEHMLLGRKKK